MAQKIDFSTLDLQDALDLAILMEKEAEERYELFADQLGERYPEDAASFFRQMSQNEHRHGRELADFRRQLFQDAPVRIDRDLIEDIEAPELNSPRPFMSPRHAMEIALESEIKAYDFFDQALWSIQNAEVRKLFEALRQEEDEHQTLLREYMERYPPELDPDVDPDEVDTPEL